MTIVTEEATGAMIEAEAEAEVTGVVVVEGVAGEVMEDLMLAVLGSMSAVFPLGLEAVTWKTCSPSMGGMELFILTTSLW